MDVTFQRRLVGLAILAAAGLVPFACVVGGSGGSGDSGDTSAPGANKVGDPCTPLVEGDFRFPGFKITEDVIELNAPECGGGVCLVNHFQGDVSCPLGQAAPRDAQGVAGCVPQRDAQGDWVVAQGSCKPGDNCVQAGSYSPKCDTSQGQEAADKFCAAQGAGGKCGANGICECKTDADCAFVTDAVVSCDSKIHQCIAYACHKPGDCQVAGASDVENAGKACCLPGTDTPVLGAVCGQCEGDGNASTRGADSAVYCSCRCGVAEGEPDDPDYPFCACPDGFECSEIRKNVGLGDEQITGKYCIKSGTAFQPGANQCGNVDGHWGSGASGDATCAGVATNECTTSGCSN